MDITKNIDFLMQGLEDRGRSCQRHPFRCRDESGLRREKSRYPGTGGRGGSVVSHVRWGEQVHAPMIEEGLHTFSSDLSG